MALWGSIDRANSSPIFTAAQFNLAANSDNRDALFTNSTADAFITGKTVGVFGVNDNEQAASLGKFPHTGWIIKTTGSGGRAGRVTYECLVAGGFSVDANVSGTPNNAIVISIHPTSKSVNDNLSTTFSINAVTAPPGGTITYLWQANTGSGFANLTNAGVYSNVTTATLSISNVHSLNAVSYQCFLRSTGAVNVTSNSATLTVV
jgi:hypothetical protein